MKDCKWNPPTAGIKGLHFTEHGRLLTRADLADLEPGTKVYKFIDDSGDRKTRRNAQRQIEQLLKADTPDADLPLEYRSSWPAADNWVVHTRHEDDKLSVEANLAIAFGIPRLQASNIFFRSQDFLKHAEFTNPENAAAVAELISMHRNGGLTRDLLGSFRPSTSSGPSGHGLLSREEALAGHLRRETAITDFIAALPIARKLTPDRSAQVVFAVNAGRHATAVSSLPEDLQDAAADLFIGHGLNAATLDGISVLGDPEDILRRLTDATPGTMQGVTVARLAELSQFLSQTGLSSRFSSPRFNGVLGEHSLQEVLEYSHSLAGKRALGLTITTASRISDTGSPGVIRGLAESARKSGLVENPLTSELCQVQAAITVALEKGKLTADDSPATVRSYLENPSDPAFHTPRLALSQELPARLGMNAQPTPLGFVSLSTANPRLMEQASVSMRVALVAATAVEGYDGVALPEYVRPADVATAAALALARNQGGTLGSEQSRRADRLVIEDSLADTARVALAEIPASPGGSAVIPDTLRASLVLREACASGMRPPTALVTALTEVVATGTFSYEEEEPANLRAIKQLASIRDGAAPESWEEKTQRLTVADTDTLRAEIEADGLLARLRAEVLNEPAVAYLRAPSKDTASRSSTACVVALAPSTDPTQVVKLLQERFPLSDNAVKIRDGELLLSLNLLSDPFAVVSHIEDALKTLSATR